MFKRNALRDITLVPPDQNLLLRRIFWRFDVLRKEEVEEEEEEVRGGEKQEEGLRVGRNKKQDERKGKKLEGKLRRGDIFWMDVGLLKDIESELCCFRVF